jgi:hypothetical protein
MSKDKCRNIDPSAPSFFIHWHNCIRIESKGSDDGVSHQSELCPSLGISNSYKTEHFGNWICCLKVRGGRQLLLKTETDPVSVTLCFLYNLCLFTIPEDGQSPQTQLFWVKKSNESSLIFLYFYCIFYKPTLKQKKLLCPIADPVTFTKRGDKV